MKSIHWWSNLPSIEINVNAPIDINVNAPIDFVKSWIWLTVRLPLQIGLLQWDVHAVTHSYLLIRERDQLSSVIFGCIQQLFRSLSIDKLQCIPDHLLDYCGEIICLHKSSFQDRLSYVDSMIRNCFFSELESERFSTSRHQDVASPWDLTCETWSNNHGRPEIGSITLVLGEEETLCMWTWRLWTFACEHLTGIKLVGLHHDSFADSQNIGMEERDTLFIVHDSHL